MTELRTLNVTSESQEAQVIRKRLGLKVVGQDEAIDALVETYEKLLSGLYDPTRPIASVLLLGPTGSGKTRITEAFTETLFFSKRKCLKVDCAEFQHSHEIAKLVGSPPGYLGHKETPPLFSNDRLKELRTEDCPFNIIIFDEIEKASDALWHLLLGVLDKGRLTTGTNEVVDLTKSIILMTSNAGVSEMDFALGKGTGFRSAVSEAVDDAAVAKVGVEAAKRKFTTEFINRLDRIVSCTALTKDQIRKVIGLEIANLEMTMLLHTEQWMGRLLVAAKVIDAVLEEGYDPKYNARNVRRVIEKKIQLPLARIISSKQVEANESIFVDIQPNGEYLFAAYPSTQECPC